MASAKENFRTAVNKTPSRHEREDAIDDLISAGECEKLALLVQLSGLRGSLRRRALNGMADADCDDLLATLAETGGLEESLQEDAEELLEREG
ncbi:hypothetical protein [Halobacterium zhouii]|uniref:hypothetical protein n=1 Tax=Halobacterium zhouii TaxID=2902624 RepID=UPI001E3EC67B|nr:hypothetical protein [Halobacterium zhouii]